MSLNEAQCILWDFDGVLMDSNPIKDLGFERVLAEYPVEEVAALMDYHRKNGGLSRYVKFRYFFEQIRKEPATESRIADLAAAFSLVVKRLMLDSSLLIQETLAFVRQNHHCIPMHIVSGSDEEELRSVCAQLAIAQYFLSVNGSPVSKKDLVARIMETYGYDRDRTVLIGDSINDYEAARENGINFLAYNNPAIQHYTTAGYYFNQKR